MGKESKVTRAGRTLHKFLKVLRELKITTFKEYGLAGEKFCTKWLDIGPQGRTERKPRTTSRDMYGSSIFSDAASFWAPDSIAKTKISKRYVNNLCRGCGNKHDVCRCRRKA